MKTETATEIAMKAGVPVSVSGLTAFGFTVPELVQILTGIYVFLMAVDKVYVMVLRYRANKKGENGLKE